MRSNYFALILVLLCAAPAMAQSNRPIGSPGEPRYVGVDYPSWLEVQAVGTTTEYLRHAGTGAPICVPWESILTLRSDQTACACWTMNLNTTIAAPSGDGGCRVTDTGGPDGSAACVDLAQTERAWLSPAWQIAPRRPGARGYTGTVGGVCSVATTTTAGWGQALSVPCTYTADCTTVVGSGSCTSYSSALPGNGGPTASGRDVQYGSGCAYIAMVAGSSANVFFGGRR